MKKASIFSLILIIISFCASAQKQPLDHSVYDSWQSIGSPKISTDGKWAAYNVNLQEGDGWLKLFNTDRITSDSIARGSNGTFAPSSEYFVWQVSPSFSENRMAKKNKLKDDKKPKSSLGIKILDTDKIIEIKNVKSFSVPEKNSDWMAYLHEKATDLKKDTLPDSGKANIKKPKTPEQKGTELVIINPLTEKEYRFSDVTDYIVARYGKSICFVKSITDTARIDNITIVKFDVENGKTSEIFQGKGSLKNLTLDKSGNFTAFLFSKDTSKVKVFDLWLSKMPSQAAKVVDISNPSMPAHYSVSENGRLSFSDDASRLYFGTAWKPVKVEPDTLLDEEKYKVDLWSWSDDILQPQQKVRLEQDQKASYQAVYHTDKNVMFQLADSLVPELRLFQKGNSDIALLSSTINYRRSTSWDMRDYSDYYLVNVESGIRKPVFKSIYSSVYLNDNGTWFLLYDYEKKAWLSMPSGGGEMKNLTGSIPYPLYDELHDQPSDPQHYGFIGWINDNRHLLVYDRYDIWLLDITGTEKPLNITNGYGRKNSTELRYIKLDDEADQIDMKETLLLLAFNTINKESGFYSLKPGKVSDPVRLMSGQFALSRNVIKAKKSDLVIFTMESWAESPTLYVSDLKFTSPVKISSINPQQKKYNWVTAELVEWRSFDNTMLQGILYKPEDFDPSKKYPMIVYFYERSSDGIYTYNAPAPSRSIINRTFAASNGYLVFVPDIPYVTGYPGQSCYNAVISGTYALVDKYSFIDSKKLALDGQSWGGYQIAWLVTQTDMFACAYSGAPVVNMTSAYGGIRWESGMSRMFQYEQSQSRIGGTLWDKPIQFIENSALFFVPKINTPLLIMHNDADGAVPWYQGIEFFTALRRLDKPSWMLTYNNEAHNLTKRPNMKDLAVRKMQFFDHYLKEKPMPEWMSSGIPQVLKGKISGYELTDK